VRNRIVVDVLTDEAIARVEELVVAAGVAREALIVEVGTRFVPAAA
jgi:hypothetical protein